jgi:hypothetical protein
MRPGYALTDIKAALVGESYRAIGAIGLTAISNTPCCRYFVLDR